MNVSRDIKNNCKFRYMVSFSMLESSSGNRPPSFQTVADTRFETTRRNQDFSYPIKYINQIFLYTKIMRFIKNNFYMN